MCIHAGILHYVFFECLLEIETIMPQINLIIWAFVARRIGSVCPRFVLLMPAGCSADAHPSVRKGLYGGNELL